MNKPPKIRWKVDPPPAGRYRSFAKRAWPMAHLDDVNESPVAYITCLDEYKPRAARYGEHRPLTVYIAFRLGVSGPGFKWVVWTKVAMLCDAKKVVAEWVRNHPEHWPSTCHQEQLQLPL